MQFLSEPTQDFFTYSHPKEICWIIYKILWLFQPIPKIYANVISTNHPCQVWFFNMLKRNICLKILKPPTSHQWHPSTCLASKNDSRAERRALSQRSAQPDWATEFSLERARLNGSKKQGTMRSEDVFRCFWGHKKVSGWILGLPLDEESSLCLYKYLFKTILRHPENDPKYTCVLTGFPKKRGTPQSSKTIFWYWSPWFCGSFTLRNPRIWVFLMLRTLWDSESYCSPWPCHGGVGNITSPVDFG